MGSTLPTIAGFHASDPVQLERMLQQLQRNMLAAVSQLYAGLNLAAPALRLRKLTTASRPDERVIRPYELLVCRPGAAPLELSVSAIGVWSTLIANSGDPGGSNIIIKPIADARDINTIQPVPRINGTGGWTIGTGGVSHFHCDGRDLWVT